MTARNPATPREAAEKAAEIAGSRDFSTVPLPQARVHQERETTARQVDAIARECHSAEAELQRVESRLEGVALTGPTRDKLRADKRATLQRLNDLRDDLADGQRRLARLDGLLANAAVEDALRSRQNAQAAGIQVAQEIRDCLARLGELWRRWTVLRDEDRVAADVVRSVAPERFGEMPTFAWATATDTNLQPAIEQVLREAERTRGALSKRVRSGT